MKKTPLYQNHIELKGRMVEFGGWLMPVQYEGIIHEHNRTRSAAGLFDVSHMGEIAVTGADAGRFIQKLITNDISGLEDFRILYSPICYPDGGTVDDVLIYRLSGEHYLIVVNASNIDKDHSWMVQNKEGSVVLEDVSDYYAQLALQGPLSQQILQKLTDFPLAELKFFRFAKDVNIDGTSAIVSRSGYTGEDGFEIYLEADNASKLWESLLEAGKDEGLTPVGLGARDTLRLEAALPLYGHELSEDISPLEAGLEKFVRLDKDGFIGKDALVNQAQQCPQRVLAGFEMTDKGIPRNGFEARSKGVKAGYVTSGGYSPSLEKNIGMALVEREAADEGNGLEITIRNKNAGAKVIKMPFYSKKYKK